MTLRNLPRYDPTKIPTVGERAIILGASMAGLAATRVLADAFEEVVVLERDELPDEPAPRDGAPQTSHPHVLLEAGRATLEDFFPGFTEDVVREGGLMVDAATEMGFYEGGDFLADGHEQMPMLCASRALFEHVTRTRVRGLDAAEIRDGCRFSRYLFDPDEERVTGVTYRDRSGEERTLRADLVVDATGRTSRTPSWLEERGYEPPRVEEVTVDVTYSTIRIERPPGDRRVLVVPPSPPRTRGAAAIPIENGQWEFIVQGLHGDDAPTEREPFVEFARSFPVPEVGELVTDHEWRSAEIHHYPFPSSVRRRYDELDRFPGGLAVIGDAVASFNPVYGQGMSVGALDALVLGHALAENGPDGVWERYFERASDLIDQAWQAAVGADFAFAKTTGPKPRGTDLFNRYVDRLVRNAHDDGRLTDAYYRVFRLERPTTSLLHPAVVWRVFRP